jgi:ATP-dependent protease ClpP protease subunit
MPFIDLPDRIPGIRAQARESRPWYRITNQAADEAEVFLYDEVGSWYGATADDFIAALGGVTASKILLRVNSPGGSVTEGIAIANALRSHPASVTVQVDGIAASIASVIAMAGDRVVMMPNSLLMVHEASGLCAGAAADMIKMAEVLDKISDNIAGAYAARAGGTEAEWRQVMRDETWYRGEEAVAAGLADEVVPAPKRGDGEPEMRQQFDLTAYGYTGPAPAKGGVAEGTQAVGEGGTDCVTPNQPAADQQPTLVISVADLLDEDTVARLRAAVAPPVENTTPVEPVAETTSVEPAPTPATEPEPEAPAAEPEPVDEWAAAVAGLVQPQPDPWAATVAHLINSTSAASSATEAA